jgi:hypothetical protein
MTYWSCGKKSHGWWQWYYTRLSRPSLSIVLSHLTCNTQPKVLVAVIGDQVVVITDINERGKAWQRRGIEGCRPSWWRKWNRTKGVYRMLKNGTCFRGLSVATLADNFKRFWGGGWRELAQA